MVVKKVISIKHTFSFGQKLEGLSMLESWAER